MKNSKNPRDRPIAEVRVGPPPASELLSSQELEEHTMPMTNSHSPASHPETSPGPSPRGRGESLLGLLPPTGGDSPVPLTKRLERLEQSLPSDDLYGDYVTQALQKLLDTSLYDLFACPVQERQELQGFFTLLAEGQRLNEPDPASEDMLPFAPSLRTYGDVLALVRDLKESSSLQENDSHIVKARDILAELARALLKSPRPREEPDPGEVISLQERLKSVGGQASSPTQFKALLKPHPKTRWNDILCANIRVQEYPILAAPVAHYFYAASRLAGSDRPFRGAEEAFKFFLTSKSVRFNLAFMLLFGLGDAPFLKWDVPDFFILYDLLVDPIFPSE